MLAESESVPFYDRMERHPAFAAAVHRARAKAKEKLVRVIVKQAPRDWRAAAFILERSWPNEYARTERIGEQADDKNLSLSNLLRYRRGRNGKIDRIPHSSQHVRFARSSGREAAALTRADSKRARARNNLRRVKRNRVAFQSGQPRFGRAD
jgi:type II secretory pathway component PulJ